MNGPTGLLSKGAPRGPTAPVRRLVLALTASTALGCSLAFATAVAQPVAQAGPADRTMRFDLPSQPLGVALDTFSRQTGWQIGYASALATGRTSRPVSGTMTGFQPKTEY